MHAAAYNFCRFALINFRGKKFVKGVNHENIVPRKFGAIRYLPKRPGGGGGFRSEAEDGSPRPARAASFAVSPPCRDSCSLIFIYSVPVQQYYGSSACTQFDGSSI